MARKFSGAAQGRGFNPIQISNAGISRMREENERIIRGMRERQESIRRNDERVLQEMKESSAYYERVRQRDYRIASQNVQTEIDQTRYEQQADQFQSEQAYKSIETAVGAITAFSETAQKVMEKLQDDKDQKEKDKILQDLISGNTSVEQEEAQVAFNAAAEEEKLGREQVRIQAAEARAQGLPEYTVQQLLNVSQYDGIKPKMYAAKLETENTWAAFRAEGLQLRGVDLTDLNAVQGAIKEIWLDYAKTRGWDNLPPEILRDAHLVAIPSNRTFLNGIEAKAAENLKVENITAATNNSIADWSGEGSMAFRAVVTANGGSNTAGHEWLYQQATLFNPETGEFYLSEDEVYNTDIYEDGTKYFIPDGKKGEQGRHPTRGLKIATERAKILRDWRRNQSTTEKQQYNARSKDYYNFIVLQGNNSPDDIAEAEAYFRSDIRGLPEWFKNYKKSGDPFYAEANSGLIKYAKDLSARGMVNDKLIREVYKVDPKLALSLQEAKAKQNPFEQNEVYKEQYDAVGNLARTKTITGAYTASDTIGNPIARDLQKLFKSRVKLAVANGVDLSDAADEEAAKLTAEVNAGRFDSTSLLYNKLNPDTGVYEFPNLSDQIDARLIVEQAMYAKSVFAEKIYSGRVNELLEEPNGVMSDEAYDKLVSDMGKPGFTYPARVAMVGERIKGSLFEVVQQIGQAKQRPPIIPPASMEIMSRYPRQSKGLIVQNNSENRNIRGNGMGTYHLGMDYNEGLVPASLREFYRASAERYDVSPAENAAMGEIESTHNTVNVNAKGMSVSYNGTSEGPMQINKYAHPEFYAEHNGNPSVEANIDYGTQYYAGLKQRYGGDVIAAAMAYNGGPGNYDIWSAGQTPDWVKTEADAVEWRRVVTEMENHGKKFAKALYKYSGDPAVLNHPILQRR